MKSRELLLDYLLQYREYQFNCFQIILFPSDIKTNLEDHQDSLISFLHPATEFLVYQIKMSQISYKFINFNELDNSVINLLFNNSDPSIIPIKEDNQYTDLFTKHPINHFSYKYLQIIPIYDNHSLIGGFFIYQDYNILWKLSLKEATKMINRLLVALNCDILDELHNEIGINNNYYSIRYNNQYYLSRELATLLNSKQIVGHLDFQDAMLNVYKEDHSNLLGLDYVLYQKISLSPLYSKWTLDNSLKYLTDYTLVLFTGTGLDIQELWNNINSLIINAKGSLGTYEAYEIKGGIILLFDKTLKQNELIKVFGNNMTTFIRNNKEVKNVDFSILLTYLESHLEEFNITKYQEYLNTLFIQKKEEISNKYKTQKFIIKKVFDSLDMTLKTILIEANKDLEIKVNPRFDSYQTLIKEYDNYQLIIKINSADFIKNNKFNLFFFNNLMKILSSKVNISFNLKVEDYYKYQKYFDQLLPFSYWSDDYGDVYNNLMFHKVLGIIIDNKYYDNLFQHNPKRALDYVHYLLTIYPKVIIKTTKHDMMKYANNNLLLIIEE